MESTAEILKKLDFKSKAQFLTATREDLEKCKTKNHDVSDHTINELYAQYAQNVGFKIENWWEEVLSGIEKIKKFNTGIDSIDNWLKKGSELCSDELVEIVGPSGGGKTTLALKIAARALLEKDAEVIYIDTTNYWNDTNVSALLTQTMSGYDIESTSDKLSWMLSRFRLYSIYTLEELVIFLSTIVSLIEKKSSKFEKPHILVIDSLSSMASSISNKPQLTGLMKEILTLFKKLNKKHYWMVIYTNNAYDGATKISELSRLVNEPMSLGFDKSIYWAKHEGLINYIVIHS